MRLLPEQNERFEQLSPWLKGRVVTRGTLELEGVEFPYVVVQHDGLDAPRWFIGLDKPSGVFFVSDEVDEFERQLMLRHEMFELAIHEGKGIGRCERALFHELSFCPEERRREYVRFRLEMFEALLTWINTDPRRRAGYTDEQIREMTLARDRLDGLTGKKFTGL